MTETRLKLSIGGLPPLSARGCTQTLTPCPMGDMRRTIAGKLVYTGQEDRQKYRSIVRGKDRLPPAFKGLKRGHILGVECLSSLTQKFMGNGKQTQMTLDRPPVHGSVIASTLDQEEVPIEIASRQVQFLSTPKSNQEIYVSYRPHLEMLVTDFEIETDEWNLTCSWYLGLEEI